MAVPGAGDALTPGTGTGRRGLTPLLLLGIVLLGALVLGLTALVAVVILARRTALS